MEPPITTSISSQDVFKNLQRSSKFLNRDMDFPGFWAAFGGFGVPGGLDFLIRQSTTTIEDTEILTARLE
jgi:hypothetical protein